MAVLACGYSRSFIIETLHFAFWEISLRFIRLMCAASSLCLITFTSSACAPAQEPVSARIQAHYEANATLAPASDVETVRYAAVGDSISEGDSPDFSGGKFGALSWPSLAPSGAVFAGGWADGGATTKVIAAAVQPMDADVLVIIAGTNDLIQGLPFSDSATNIQAIADKSGVGRVVVSAVPPYNHAPAASAEFNDKLQELALREGWDFVDAVAGVRDGDTFAAGMTTDGIHPSAEGVKSIAAALGPALFS